MPASEHNLSCIVGLGNPGEDYRTTYHNVGFLALDSFLEAVGTKWQRSSSARFAYHKEGPYIFVKPLTYMNLSGGAVKEALAYFKLDRTSLLVIHDDIDLPVGSYRFSSDRGHAGHRGVASIIQTLGGKDFSRLRIGIGPQEKDDGPRPKAEDLVLKPIRTKDRELLSGVFEQIKKEHLPLL